MGETSWIDENTWIWWVVAAAVALAVVVGLILASRRRTHRDEARVEAGALRERAHGGEDYVAGVEERAREAQAAAHTARAEADRLQQKADEATNLAREYRDRVTDNYLKADEIDPDAKR
ncbi:hypothetical protein [Ornithinimicrobium sp. LYQ103]|uniref:hypothetical protein n=1 Tax=Ornithinimicrobium sp. LYQ103 TaxID=3378796 RepID=UPI003853A1FA